MNKPHYYHINLTKDFPENFKKTPGRPKTFINPGRLTNLHNRIESISPEWFEGAQIGCNVPISKRFAATFNYLLSHTSTSGVRVGGIYNERLNDKILVIKIVFLILCLKSKRKYVSM